MLADRLDDDRHGEQAPPIAASVAVSLLRPGRQVVRERAGGQRPPRRPGAVAGRENRGESDFRRPADDSIVPEQPRARVYCAEPERRVDKAQLAEFRRVANKENVLYTVTGVSVAHPDGLVREVVYPAVGEQTLKDLVAEAKATESRRRAQVRTVLGSSYSHHYRTMLPKLLDALQVRCNNTAYRPVLDAVDLLHRYKDRDGRLTHYEPVERVPLDGVVKTEWRAAVVDERGRVERIGYELCALGALRDALRRGEVWVVGAKAWRNPETHLPVDFDLHRDVHYEAIAQPIDPTQFVSSLRTRVDTSLAATASPTTSSGV